MIVLDTDHIVEWLNGSSEEAHSLHARLAGITEEVAITIAFQR